jgi:hypothetical protein
LIYSDSSLLETTSETVNLSNQVHIGNPEPSSSQGEPQRTTTSPPFTWWPKNPSTTTPATTTTAQKTTTTTAEQVYYDCQRDGQREPDDDYCAAYKECKKGQWIRKWCPHGTEYVEYLVQCSRPAPGSICYKNPNVPPYPGHQQQQPTQGPESGSSKTTSSSKITNKLDFLIKPF